MHDLRSEEIDLLRQNARSMVRELGLLNDAYFNIGVTLAERHLLIELNGCIYPTVGEIAERLLLDKSSASRLITKAVKKGYVAYVSDQKDKRKRCLAFTEKGKKILHAFEPIAFSQTQEALRTLTAEEVETVYRGVALYAQGLKNSRLKDKNSQKIPANSPELEKIYQKLKGLGYVLEPFQQVDEKAFYAIFRSVIDSGSQFPYECNSVQEFHRQFLNPQAHVYVCRSSAGEVIGGFYIRANFSGRSSHIANAAYMVESSHRNKGIGSLLIQASLYIAKELSFHAMQFNMVLSQNHSAARLYQKLGFTILGTLPQAVRNSDGSFQDGYIMHKKL